MLTSTNQYLRPEYLTPLPTTLDAKKSPLALLAQTCSQIGADKSNPKLVQSSDKVNKSSKFDSETEKIISNSNDLIMKTNYKSEPMTTVQIKEEKLRTPEESSGCGSTAYGINTPITYKVSANERCSSNQSVVSHSASPSASPDVTDKAFENNEELIDSIDKPNQSVSPCSSKTAFTPNILTSSSDPSIKDLPLGTFKPGLQATSSLFLSGYSSGFSLPADIMSNSLIPQNHNLKSGALCSYLGFGRMKTTDSISSMCRDPYCAGCSVSSNLLGASTSGKTVSCVGNCVQCDHTKPSSTGYMNHNSAATIYAHAQLAALAAVSHLPYVCNWISGDATYCGKRFSNSEELLTHLRTHTSAGLTETSSALPMLNSTVLPPTHSLLPRSYPTPPLSPLTTARYHPYTKPSLIHPSLNSPSLSSFAINHPVLSPYISQYSLYGPRIGATPGMHQ